MNPIELDHYKIEVEEWEEDKLMAITTAKKKFTRRKKLR